MAWLAILGRVTNPIRVRRVLKFHREAFRYTSSLSGKVSHSKRQTQAAAGELRQLVVQAVPPAELSLSPGSKEVDGGHWF